MTKMISDPMRFGRAALAVTVMLGVLALAAALASQGCASKGRVAEVQPTGREVPPAEISAAAPPGTVSPEAKISDARIPPVPAGQPHGKDDGGSPVKQETAPSSATVPSRRATSPSVKTPKAPAAPAPSEPARATKDVEPSPSRQAAAPALDLKSLETRLRETKAIGIFTKLSLKNKVDDLLSQLQAFHQGKGGKLPELRQSYDLLMMKVLSPLQDSDPSLARDIVTSREAIWSMLADPVKFSTLS
jgi:hypothetical protein